MSGIINHRRRPIGSSPVLPVMESLDPASYQHHLRGELRRKMEENMRLAYSLSDCPALIKKQLLGKLHKRNYSVGLALRCGWEAWMQAKKDSVTNMAIVSALILSVLLGLIFGAPEAIEAEDGLKDVRSACRDIFILCCIGSCLLAMFSIFASIYYIKYLDQSVTDLDDYISFDTHFKKKIIELPCIASLVLAEIALAVGCLVIFKEAVAWPAFSVTVLFTVAQCVFIGILSSRVKTDVRRRMGDQNNDLREIIESVYDELYPAKTGTMGDE